MRSGRMLATGLSALLVPTYPFLVYVGLSQGGWRVLGLAILVLAACRLALFRGAGAGPVLAATSAAAAGLAAIALLSGTPDFLLYYPVAVNGAMLAIFSVSLRRPPTVIERLARLRHPDLPPSGVAWTRKVTMIWCLFFIVNGGLSLATVLSGDVELWTIYNGFLSYIAMGVLLGGEFIARRFVVGRAGA